TLWRNKKGKEKEYNASEVWKAIKIDYPKVIWSDVMKVAKVWNIPMNKDKFVNRMIKDLGNDNING
nr:hypothetical protein [Tanacetum cinerariifolium]